MRDGRDQNGWDGGEEVAHREGREKGVSSQEVKGTETVRGSEEESPEIYEETLLLQEIKMERDTLELKRFISHLAHGHRSLGLFRLQDYRGKSSLSFPSLLHAQPRDLNQLWRR